jgi:hypothetical protein
MMSRAIRALGGLVLVFGLTAPASAGPITLFEEFVFPQATFPGGLPPDQAYYVGSDPAFCGGGDCQRTFVQVLFDLNATQLANASNVGTLFAEIMDEATFATVAGPLPWQTAAPTTDASGYTPGSALASGTLSLEIRGLDAEDDNVLVEVFAVDGGGTLWQQTYAGSLSSTSIVLPLGPTLLAALAADGQLGLSFSSFGTDLTTYDFNLVAASLEAATVPEPGMMLLLAAGVATLRARFVRRRASSRLR